MEMPQPGAEHRALDRLVGEWRGAETMNPMPWGPGGTVAAWVRNVPALHGFAVVQDYAQEKDGVATFTGHGVFHWDAESAEYVLHWFDSLVQRPREFRGRFDDDTLTMVSPDPRGHTRATWELGAPNEYSYRMDVSPSGEEWTPFLTGRYQRENR